MNLTSSRAAYGALFFGAITIGFAPILVRLTETGPAAGGMWRMLLALPLLLVPMLRNPATRGDGTLKWGLLAGLFIGLDMLAWHYSLKFTSIANATVLCNMAPVIVALVSWLVFKETLSRLFIGAVALSLVGATMVGLAKGSGGHGVNPPVGDMLAILGACFYGGYFVMVRLGRRTISTSQLMFWSTLSSAPILLVAALVLREQLLPTGLSGWAACAGLALVHVFGQGSIAWAMGRLPASLASVVVLIQPVMAAALSWLFFAEPVVAAQAAGAAVLLVGVVLAQRAQMASDKAEKQTGPEMSPDPSKA
jgi:drug/metabolite transporter (DMT)-like permease